MPFIVWMCQSYLFPCMDVPLCVSTIPTLSWSHGVCQHLHPQLSVCHKSRVLAVCSSCPLWISVTALYSSRVFPVTFVSFLVNLSALLQLPLLLLLILHKPDCLAEIHFPSFRQNRMCLPQAHEMNKIGHNETANYEMKHGLYSFGYQNKLINSIFLLPFGNAVTCVCEASQS